MGGIGGWRRRRSLWLAHATMNGLLGLRTQWSVSHRSIIWENHSSLVVLPVYVRINPPSQSSPCCLENLGYKKTRLLIEIP